MLSLQDLHHTLQTMTPRSKSFQLVKAEMQKRGYWKNKARGKGFKSNDDRRGKL